MRTRLRALGPEARIRMATGMFSAARSLVRAGSEHTAETTLRGRELLLARLYSRDLDPKTLEAVRRRLADEEGARAPTEEPIE